MGSWYEQVQCSSTTHILSWASLHVKAGTQSLDISMGEIYVIFGVSKSLVCEPLLITSTCTMFKELSWFIANSKKAHQERNMMNCALSIWACSGKTTMPFLSFFFFGGGGGGDFNLFKIKYLILRLLCSFWKWFYLVENKFLTFLG